MTNTVPVIDLDGCLTAPSGAVIRAVADAAERFGFFQVVNHGIASDQIDQLWLSTRAFFALPRSTKLTIERTKENARGFYDRELTKNRRDLKEVLDLAHVPFPALADDHPKNVHRVDGVNQWPELQDFRSSVQDYLVACNTLALWLLQAFCRGLGEHADHLQQSFDPMHTSFLRMNHYPLTDPLPADEAASVTELGDMALHHHTDAGALTLLLQDNVGGLQVEHQGKWVDVEPIAGALVVNTGDMMQVWSNGRYQAALHRVAPRVRAERFSLPYFFNPSYDTVYQPLPGSIQPGDSPKYGPINWGDFRQARADGDYADYGSEVQIGDFVI